MVSLSNDALAGIFCVLRSFCRLSQIAVIVDVNLTL